MAGLIQIVIFILCVYIIFKGVEIYQIASMSVSEHRDKGKGLGVLMIIIAVIVAILGFIAAIGQGASIQTR